MQDMPDELIWPKELMRSVVGWGLCAVLGMDYGLDTAIGGRFGLPSIEGVFKLASLKAKLALAQADWTVGRLYYPMVATGIRR